MSVMGLIHRPAPLFIGGGFRPAHGAPITVTDPSTGEAFAEVAAADTWDVDAAVAAAVTAFPGWSRRAVAERAAYLRAIAAGLRSREADLIALQVVNNGKPKAEAEIDVADAVATFDYYAAEAEALGARQGSPVAMPEGFLGRTRFEPVGPVGMIVPWNFPLVTSAWKIAPALAAGCTVVLKTSEFTPLIELVYGDIATETDLPSGVLNLITGDVVAGAALSADARLAKLSFTGSNAVGAKVMAAAAARCLPVALELGGKSPIVVLEDADLDHAVDCIAAGIFYNAGQMCSATSRLIAQASIADDLLTRLAVRAKGLRVGAPGAAGTEMGPITTRPQHQRVLATLDRARRDGLTTPAGGGAGSLNGGFFVEPTIFSDVPASNPVWRDEIFGPVLATTRVRDDEAAILAANDTAYGLVATIVSGDPERAERMAARIEAGHIWINSVQVIPPQTAWGGFKASGIGRELGPWGLSSYLGVKHLTIAGAAA